MLKKLKHRLGTEKQFTALTNKKTATAVFLFPENIEAIQDLRFMVECNK
ncbi:hypothetical protein [Polynucleobacter sp. MWH-Tro8-2-5-gr]|nr:hypothetical protein [Polynucleobacter sp. MWH-Tro8-2-5-gr]